MNYKMVTIFALLLQTSMYSLAAQGVKTTESTSPRELKSEVMGARTADRLHAEAETYRRKESTFRSQAQLENVELARRVQQANGRTFKYPSSVDSARYLYQYYTAKADEMETKALLVDSQTASVR